VGQLVIVPPGNTPSSSEFISFKRALYFNIFTSKPARSAIMPVLFLLSGPKIGFSPPGATCCPNKRGN